MACKNSCGGKPMVAKCPQSAKGIHSGTRRKAEGGGTSGTRLGREGTGEDGKFIRAGARRARRKVTSKTLRTGFRDQATNETEAASPRETVSNTGLRKSQLPSQGQRTGAFSQTAGSPIRPRTRGGDGGGQIVSTAYGSGKGQLTYRSSDRREELGGAIPISV